VTRPDHRDPKAGNHNHALRLSTAPFIVSMDADFLPFPHFIYRTIGFFRSVILLAAMWWLGRQQFIPFFWQGFQLFMAFELVPQALLSLMKPFGTLLLQINAVPAKGQATYARSPAYWC
jgi:hypothetical protein